MLLASARPSFHSQPSRMSMIFFVWMLDCCCMPWKKNEQTRANLFILSFFVVTSFSSCVRYFRFSRLVRRCRIVRMFDSTLWLFHFFFFGRRFAVQNVCSIRFSLLLLLIFCVFDNFMCWQWWRRTHTHATRPCGTYAIGAMSVEDATHTIQSRWYWVPDGKFGSHTAPHGACGHKDYIVVRRRYGWLADRWDLWIRFQPKWKCLAI